MVLLDPAISSEEEVLLDHAISSEEEVRLAHAVPVVGVVASMVHCDLQ